MSSSNNIADTIIRKVRPQFEQTRFKWFNPTDYHLYQNNEMQCVWKISAFEGVKACFLMDVYPLTARNFDKAVRKMVSDVKKECGLFLYVGHLHFTPLSMVKIPRRFEPKAFRFDCRILDKEKLSKVQSARGVEAFNWLHACIRINFFKQLHILPSIKPSSLQALQAKEGSK